MPGRKFGHNSPYDESGMPLGTTTADYDNAEEIRLNQVHSTYEEPLPLNDPKYQAKQVAVEETPKKDIVQNEDILKTLEEESLKENNEEPK